MARTKKQRKKRKKAQQKKPAGRLVHGRFPPAEGPRCGLCGKSGNVIRTECCDEWICDDEDEYVVFSYARNSCWRNHHRFTLCGHHHVEQHPGHWQDCEACKEGQETEMYVWYGTNEYNFVQLRNPPEYEPTLCAGCDVVIRLGNEPWTMSGGGYYCELCSLEAHPHTAQLFGMEPEEEAPPAKKRERRKRKPRRKTNAKPLEVSPGDQTELIVLSTADNSARCRLPGSERECTLRSSRIWSLVPGEVTSVITSKSWVFGSHPFLSGEITGYRRDIPALGLVSLKLREAGLWDPDDHYWGEEDEPLEEWAVPIAAKGPRPQFEMEQFVPGKDYSDLAYPKDPILDAVDMMQSGEFPAARDLLMDLLAEDLRCLDAHAHLGNVALQWNLEHAQRHYGIGVGIGDQSLGPGFEGVLPWGLIDNRPFLRCLHGLGLSLWRQERYEEALIAFERMLWLNPTDNQGARFLIDDVRTGIPWREEEASLFD